MQLGLNPIALIKLIDNRIEPLANALLIFRHACAYVESHDRQIGNDICRTAAVDATYIQGDARDLPVDLMESSNRICCCDDGAAALLEIATRMSRAPVDQQRE